jgi:ribosomal protein L12E/L44/L45/RPP1/RPP2
MTEAEYDRKLEELDRLLNDPDVPMQPARVWTLLAEISHRDLDGVIPEVPADAGKADFTVRQ